MPVVIAAGAGVSLVVNPAPPFASGIAMPEAGFINLPDDVAVIT